MNTAGNGVEGANHDDKGEVLMKKSVYDGGENCRKAKSQGKTSYRNQG
jgi:hypothetical protein